MRIYCPLLIRLFYFSSSLHLTGLKLSAIELIQHQQLNFHPHLSTILQIRSLLARNWSVRLQHCYREGNAPADWLAKHGASNADTFSLLADSSGPSIARP